MEHFFPSSHPGRRSPASSSDRAWHTSRRRRTIVFLFRASKFRITGWKCSFKFATQEECSILFPFSSSSGIFDVMVSAYSERATSGLVSHSHVNGCSLFRILEGSGASLASPYGVTKLRTHCCHHFTPWGLVGDFAVTADSSA